MSASATVRDVLAGTPVIDGHNDLPMALRERTGGDVLGLDRVRGEFHTDLVRLRTGGAGAQFWSVFVPSSIPEDAAVVATAEQIDTALRLIEAYPDVLVRASTAADIERAWSQGRIASLLGIEGGQSIARSLGVLRSFARLGVRYMTLTHNDDTAWADSATGVGTADGLTDEGRAVVAEMNRIGMIVDLSHTAAATQRAALKSTTAPVIFSHSSARAVNDHPRNVDDAVLRLLAENGGVLQVTFVPAFLSADRAAWERAEADERARLDLPSWTWPRAPRPGENPADTVVTPVASAELDRWVRAHPAPAVTVADVVAHVEHARAVAGIDHVGLGGDYDGTSVLPEGLEDVSGYPRLLAALAERGWSGADLEQLTGRNVLRVMRDVEDAATEPLWP
ncbi:dipeptidase [Microbacterium gorillae]|uniref:dipeptidase n=1 Tax=Microbacterium gorillae TaxID=1231063 RepID=UPI0005904495|nr:dipeptidase [Microbacterium gorillae]